MRKKTEALIPASFFLGNKHHLGTPDDLGAMLCQALNAHLKLKMSSSAVFQKNARRAGVRSWIPCVFFLVVRSRKFLAVFGASGDFWANL